MQVTHALDKPRLFWLRENPEDPQNEPHAGINMAQGLVSLLYICGVNPKVLGTGSDLPAHNSQTIMCFVQFLYGLAVVVAHIVMVNLRTMPKSP